MPTWLSHGQELESASSATDIDNRELDDLEPTSQTPTSFTNAVALTLSWTRNREESVDFAQTPTWHTCQSRELTANHVFFTAVDQQSGEA